MPDMDGLTQREQRIVGNLEITEIEPRELIRNRFTDTKRLQYRLREILRAYPQYAEGGWPEYCATDARDPTRRESAAMADIMGSGGLAWYEWKKHGRCSGLAPEDYFATARRLYRALDLPAPDDGRATAAAVEAAFLAANPALTPEAVIVTCGDGRVEEVRLCLTRDFAPRACGADVLRDACRARGPLEVPSAE